MPENTAKKLKGMEIKWQNEYTDRFVWELT